MRLDHNFVLRDPAKGVAETMRLLHAETLREVGRVKLPFAGYSVGRGMADPSQRSLTLLGTTPTPLAPRATSRQADE